MANMSDTSGKFKITANSKKAIKRLLKLHSIFEERALYSTTLSHANYYTKHDSKVTLEGDFVAIGRWSFNSNVSCFFECINVNSTNEKAAKLSEKVFDESFEVEFDFVDCESGCDFIEKGTAKLSYLSGRVTIDYDVEISVNYTEENLKKYVA